MNENVNRVQHFTLPEIKIIKSEICIEDEDVDSPGIATSHAHFKVTGEAEDRISDKSECSIFNEVINGVNNFVIAADNDYAADVRNNAVRLNENSTVSAPPAEVGKENPILNPQRVAHPPHHKSVTGVCRVCGDEATGMYFGALVCVSCKVYL